MPILLSFLFCGDEVTDILYVIFNWDNFATPHHKNAALAFIILNGVANLISALLVLAALKNIRNMQGVKMYAFACFCGWIPVFGIVFTLLYFKFFDLAIKCGAGDLLFDDLNFVRGLIGLLHYCELFLEDIPQLIIQATNNSQTGSWNVLEYISLAFTITIILYDIIKFIFCK